MQIARLSIERPIYTWLLIIFCLFGGGVGYLSVGKLEDPVFTLKTALVITPWPGATAEEVAIGVSEVIESGIQQMDEVRWIASRNAPGLSVVTVEIKDIYGATELPQVWDDLRDRVADAVPDLPPGALMPTVNDGFGDVFGLFYAITAPGFPDAQIHDIAVFLRREALSVQGVASAEAMGMPEEVIYVEPDSRSLATLGVPQGALIAAISGVNTVTPTGTMATDGRNLRIEPPAAEAWVGDLSALSFGVEGRVVNLTDFATIARERTPDPSQVVRHNGVEAFTLAVAGLTSENIVDVGARLEARLEEIRPLLPAGVEIHPIYEQHEVVAAANTEFLVSLAVSVAVVIGVLALFMGWRAAVVVGATLFLNVVGTFFFMSLFDIKVERISLGALIIAMGMLVDNAIVMAEGMQVEMRRGRRPTDAAAEVARKTQVPLLAATVIGVMAFAGIGLSPDSSGEFLFSLFAVISISLLLSWVLAVTVTPYLASRFFKAGQLEGANDPYDTAFFRAYGKVVRLTLRLRWLVIVGLFGTTVACLAAFGSVTQQFFPPANTPLFYFNYKAQQGTDIHAASADLRVIEDWLAARPDVVATTTTIGQGLSRFLLTYTPEQPEPSWGQIVIRATDFAAIPGLRDELTAFASAELPWAETRVEQIIYGPPVGADVEVRISGPDRDVLRGLADEALAIFQAAPNLTIERSNWRERELVTRPVHAADRAQAMGIARGDVAQALALATDGVRVGTFRDGERLIPITVRTPRNELTLGTPLADQLVFAPVLGAYVPLDQAIDGWDVLPRDTMIHRRDRQPTISVQGFVPPGVLPPAAFTLVREQIEAIDLPPGYSLEWGGEYESATTAQASLGRQMPLAFGTMLLITILLFGRLRQTAVIWTVVPMAVNGVALGLFLSGLPFSFTALLGLLSLSGMLIKNAIVLVEEIDLQKAEGGLPQSEAIVTASVSRLRPVMLAAATTILGLAPLLWDVFFASMAVTIMAGLGFATVLTLVGIPALYHTYLRAERQAEKPVYGNRRNALKAQMTSTPRLAAE